MITITIHNPWDNRLVVVIEIRRPIPKGEIVERESWQVDTDDQIKALETAVAYLKSKNAPILTPTEELPSAPLPA